jgi:succinate dehydrogenase/fumarate reductase iron-sulfur protein
MPEDVASVKIYKFDPSVDKEGRFDIWEVPAEAWRGVKVIDTLRYIHEHFDPELSFREPCRQQLCGACTMVVNDKLVLACDTFSQQNMVIKPLSNHKIIKDLVVEL